ncbi:MAG: AarF/ABC1/UbiB kinase family protein [Proteobacteria bacterium]|nr:AarF/ABC1/UbiB kinase family protein [Pseudomonadota bacterium]
MPKLISRSSVYHRMNRYREVVHVLVKYGFGQLLDDARIWEQTNIERRILHRHPSEIEHLTRAERVRMAIEELGPTFIKVGQFLSTRPDLVPQSFLVEFEKLQSNVAPIPSEVAKAIIESELGQSLDAVFSSFEEEPIAAASLSQVHRAVLGDEEVVAIKVQRPNIADIIAADLDIMLSLANSMEQHLEQARMMNVSELVNEFSANITRELNFKTEANNLSRFARNFADDQYILIPAIHRELCTRRVLVMEYVEGINISKTEELVAGGYDLQLIASRGVDLALKSAFEHGFFHADPHPGNIFVLPDNAICVLDFGMMGVLSSRDRDSLASMVNNIVDLDERSMVRAILALSEADGAVREADLEMAVSNLVQEYATLPFKELSLGDLLNDLMQVARAHHLHFRSHLVWLLKSIATIEDVAHRLVPDFDIVESVTPYAQKLLRRRYSPFRQAREFRSAAIDFMYLAKDLPHETRTIIRQLREGRVRIEFEHVGLEPMRNTLDRISNRLAISIILSALLIGSSVLVLSEVPPLVSDIPIIGLAGYIIAGVLGIWLTISMLRSGRM